MNKTKVLRYGIIILEVVTLVIAVLSLHTIVMVLVGAVSEDTFNLQLNLDESTGDLFLTVDGDLRNEGILDVSLSFELALLNSDGAQIGNNSTSMNIKAGSVTPFFLNLQIPAEVAQDLDLDSLGSLEITFSVRTLGDLVGFTNVMRLGGGGGE